MEPLKIYRKRIIPQEIVLLKDDVIVKADDDIIVTKWNTLKPKTGFSHGCSCYYLKKGVKVSGATVHFVSEEVDGGPIIYQEAVSIADLDDAGAIQQRVLEIEHKILPMVVSYYCQGKIKIEKGRVHIL